MYFLFLNKPASKIKFHIKFRILSRTYLTSKSNKSNLNKQFTVPELLSC